MRDHRVRRAAFLLLTAALLAGCGASADAGGPDVAGDWELAEGTADGTVLSQPAGARATLQFEEAQVRGVSFCNHYFSEYRLDGTSVSFAGLGGTDMGCDPPIMAAESAFLTALGAAHTVAMEDGDLLVTGDDVRLRFTRVEPVPGSELTGTRWVLETLIDGETASSTLGEPAVLQLAGDGTFEGSTGCRTLAGTWTTSGDEVLFPDMRADGDCPAGVARQDSHVVEVLGDGFQVQVEAERLTLSDPSGLGLVYRAG